MCVHMFGESSCLPAEGQRWLSCISFEFESMQPQTDTTSKQTERISYSFSPLLNL